MNIQDLSFLIEDRPHRLDQSATESDDVVVLDEPVLLVDGVVDFQAVELKQVEVEEVEY